MSNKAVGWALEIDLKDPVEKLVLVILADHWREDTEAAWPSLARISRIAGIEERSVRRVLGRLIRKRAIQREKRSGTSSIFRLLMDPGHKVLPRVEHPGHKVISPRTLSPPTPPLSVPLSSHGTSQLTSETKSKLASHEEWKKRLAGYRPSEGKHTWKASWGALPDSAGTWGHLTPPDLRAVWLAEEKQRMEKVRRVA